MTSTRSSTAFQSIRSGWRRITMEGPRDSAMSSLKPWREPLLRLAKVANTSVTGRCTSRPPPRGNSVRAFEMYPCCRPLLRPGPRPSKTINGIGGSESSCCREHFFSVWDTAPLLAIQLVYSPSETPYIEDPGCRLLSPRWTKR